MEEIINNFRLAFKYNQYGRLKNGKMEKTEFIPLTIDNVEIWLKEKLTDFEQSIRSEDKKTIGELYERLQGVEDTHIRLGDLSSWKNYGIRQGYWDYFEKEIKDKVLKEMRSKGGKKCVENNGVDYMKKISAKGGETMKRKALIKSNAEKDGVTLIK